jgi:D-sedoheptulose 7-phosphate isomerase
MDNTKIMLSMALPRSIGQEDEIIGNIMGGLQVKKILHLAEAIVVCLQNGHKVVTFGNGGSAAEAMHIVCELVGRCTIDRKSLPAVCLATNPATLTAIGNDFGFEHVFSHQVEGLVNPKDIVIGISTSGRSVNVINGIHRANDKEAITFGYTGEFGGELLDRTDCCIRVPSNNTLRIQEAHMVITHIVCELVEKMMFENKEGSNGE